MLPNHKTWTSALIFAAVTLIIPVLASGKTQIPAHYTVNTAVKYDASAVQQSYVALAGGLHSNALGAALTLATAVEALNQVPNAASLTAARAAWTSARSSYLATEAFRFYGGPIDGPKTELRAAGPETKINSNFNLLEQALWRTNNALIAPPAAMGINGKRQREGLASATAALQSDVAFLLKEWDPIRRTGYAQQFLQLEGPEAVGRVLRGLGMQAITLSNAPSDTRASDAAAVLSGMISIWHAQLNKITAPSIEAMLSKVDPNAAAAVSSALATAQTQVSAKDPALPETLRKLAVAIVNAGTSLGVAIAID